MNWKMVIFRGIQAPVGLIGLALCGWAASWWLRDTPFGPVLAELMGYGFPACLAAAGLAYSYFFYRLIRWERSQGSECCD